MKYFLFFLVTVLAAGCQSSSSRADVKGSPAAETVAPASGNRGTEITVELKGGTNAGIYKVSSNESTCSMGLTGEKSFGNQYSVTGKGDKELSSVQMIAEDYDEAKKGTSNFNAQFSFGSLINGSSFSLAPSKNMGTGKLTITESGGAKTATIEGATKEGVAIRAVIICRTIQKIVDGQLKEE